MSSPNWLERALDQEERADRYQTGTKAHRLYLSSCEDYSQAHLSDPSDTQILYNWARILFILAEFKDPKPSVQEQYSYLTQSIEKFRKVVDLEKDPDAIFNLAQSQLALVHLIRNDHHQENLCKTTLEEAYQLLQSTQQTDSSVFDLEMDILITSLEFMTDNYTLELCANKILEKIQSQSSADTTELGLSLAHFYHSFAEKRLQISGFPDSNLYQLALNHLSKILESDPRHIEALCDYADVEIDWADALIHSNVDESKRMYASAVDYLTKALTIEPRNFSILEKLGDAQLTRILFYPGEAMEKTRKILASNAKIYYEKALKDTMDIRMVYHLWKANTYIPEMSAECQRLSQLMTQDQLNSIEDPIPIDFGSVSK